MSVCHARHFRLRSLRLNRSYLCGLSTLSYNVSSIGKSDQCSHDHLLDSRTHGDCCLCDCRFETEIKITECQHALVFCFMLCTMLMCVRSIQARPSNTMFTRAYVPHGARSDALHIASTLLIVIRAWMEGVWWPRVVGALVVCGVAAVLQCAVHGPHSSLWLLSTSPPSVASTRDVDVFATLVGQGYPVVCVECAGGVPSVVPFLLDETLRGISAIADVDASSGDAGGAIPSERLDSSSNAHDATDHSSFGKDGVQSPSAHDTAASPGNQTFHRASFWVRDDTKPLVVKPPPDAHQRRRVNAKLRDVLTWCGHSDGSSHADTRESVDNTEPDPAAISDSAPTRHRWVTSTIAVDASFEYSCRVVIAATRSSHACLSPTLTHTPRLLPYVCVFVCLCLCLCACACVCAHLCGSAHGVHDVREDHAVG